MKASLRETVKAPPAFGPALALEYRRLLVPVVAGQPSDDALDVACSLAAERGARIVALNVLEVPLGRPLDDDLDELEDAANDELDEAIAIGDSYGVRVLDRLVRARSAGPAIVEEAEQRGTEIIVIGTPRKSLTAVAARGLRPNRRLRAPARTLPGDGHGLARRGARMIWYRRAILVFSGCFVLIGLALLVVTAVNGGGLVGFVLGGLFVALGVGRIQLERKRGA